MVTKTDHDKDCEFRLDQGGSLCSCGFVKNKRVMTKADKRESETALRKEFEGEIQFARHSKALLEHTSVQTRFLLVS